MPRGNGVSRPGSYGGEYTLILHFYQVQETFTNILATHKTREEVLEAAAAAEPPGEPREAICDFGFTNMRIREYRPPGS